MVEMTETAAILNQADAHSLVLMDEIGRGTSTFDGLALASAVLKQVLRQNKSLTLFATHYFELTRLSEKFKQLENVHLNAVEHHDRIVFLHRVQPGPANQSYGIEVAALAGIPGNVVRDARRTLLELEAQSIHHSQMQAEVGNSGGVYDNKTDKTTVKATGKTYAGGVMLGTGHISAGIKGKDTFIGELDGRACMVSTFRLGARIDELRDEAIIG